MLWFWLALGSAFFLATTDLLLKRFFSDLPLGQMVAARFAGIIPMCVIILAASPEPLTWRPCFWLAAGIALPLEVVALMLYNRAIQVSPLWVSLPFLSFTPMFAMLTGYLILGEIPSVWGAAGVSLVVVGAYTLNLGEVRRGWAEPLRAVTREQGSRLMLTVSAIYGCTVVLSKYAIGCSGPWFVAGAYPLLVSLGTAVVLPWGKGWGWDWLKRPLPLAAVTVCAGGMLVCHFLAVSMAPAAYMVSIKRLSALMGVIYGGMLLGEPGLMRHAGATAVMLAGSALVLLWG